MFQSSPLSQEGRYRTACLTTNRLFMFQSSPLSQEGRYNLWPDGERGGLCFNPRPSRKRGATVEPRRQPNELFVSILAPLARGALPCRTTCMRP